MLLNAGAVAANWRLSTRSFVNLARSQVYHTERPRACSPWCSASTSRGFCQFQLILVMHCIWCWLQIITSWYFCLWKTLTGNYLWVLPKSLKWHHPSSGLLRHLIAVHSSWISIHIFCIVELRQVMKLQRKLSFYRKLAAIRYVVHGRGCNPHRSTTTFANLEITSLWRHWWRHNSETIRDREKRRPPRAMKSSELANDENRIALRQFCKSGNDVIDGNCKKWLERILVLVRCTV